MIDWLVHLFGFDHKRGLSQPKAEEVARLHAETRRVLRNSIVVRISLMASINKSANGSKH